MQKRLWPLFGVCALMLAIGLPIATAHPGHGVETAVRVLPAGGAYPVGGEIEVEVWVENVRNFYGADVQLAFDATRMQVLDAEPSEPGTQITPRDDLLSPDLVVEKEADNALGQVSYVVTQLNPSEPVTGTGAILSFTLETLGPGEDVPVDVESVLLATRDGDPIPADAYGAQYTIGADYRIFLPLTVKNR